MVAVAAGGVEEAGEVEEEWLLGRKGEEVNVIKM